MKNTISSTIGRLFYIYTALALAVLVFPVSQAMADGGGDGFGGMMEGGMMGNFGPSGMWYLGGLGMLLGPIFWLAFLALSVFVIRKAWDLGGKKKKKK